ncbi:hypothetical protein M1367_01705 [Candidatus Marsarchaeota archaeon]|nr:hypothetical protein [Candidatus Marsarchaeota archaeon]
MSKRFFLYDFEPLATLGYTATMLYPCSNGKQQMVVKVGLEVISLDGKEAFHFCGGLVSYL